MKDFLKYISNVLAMICEFQHWILPEKTDDALQRLFIKILGYYCPFTSWSFWLSEKYNLGVWRKSD